MRYFGLVNDGEKFFARTLRCYTLQVDYKVTDYIKSSLSHLGLLDMRAKSRLKFRESITSRYDKNSLEDILEFWIMKTLEKDLENSSDSPLVRYCKELYRHRTPLHGGDLLRAMKEWVKSFN